KGYRFTGKERDEESGLSYHGARYYAPHLGRWTSCDPRGPTDSVNLYRYLSRAPTVAVDPSGEQTVGILPQVDTLRRIAPLQPAESIVRHQARVPASVALPTGMPVVGIGINRS